MTSCINHYNDANYCQTFRPHLSIMCEAICQFHQPFTYEQPFLNKSVLLLTICAKGNWQKGACKRLITSYLNEPFVTSFLNEPFVTSFLKEPFVMIFRKFSRQPLCQASKVDLWLRLQRSTTMEVSTSSAGQPGNVSPALFAQLVR